MSKPFPPVRLSSPSPVQVIEALVAVQLVAVRAAIDDAVPPPSAVLPLVS